MTTDESRIERGVANFPPDNHLSETANNLRISVILWHVSVPMPIDGRVVETQGQGGAFVDSLAMSFVVMIVQASMFESSKRRGRLRLAIGLGFFIGAATSLSAQQKTLTLTQRIVFHIPAQPLARALLAYGSATGFALYYNAEFAEGRRSRAVMQTLQPVEALDRLLEGTGLVPQITGPASFILIPAQRDVARPTPGGSAPGPYESYFADIQKRIGAVLCSKATAGQQDEETFLQVWLATSGVISRVDLFTANGDGANRTDLVKALQGLSVAPPPSDMPQPVTLVVFPPNSAWKTCRSTDRALEAR